MKPGDRIPLTRLLPVAAVFWILFYTVASLDLYLVVGRYAAVTFRSLFVDDLAWVAAWTALTPVVLRLRRERPLRPAQPGPAWGFHLAASAVLALSFMLLGVTRTLWREDLPAGTFGSVAFATFDLRWLLHLTNYWTIILGAHAWDLFLAARAGEQQARELRHALTEAQLTALRARLQPHFLFNTFNAIASLVRQNQNDRAVEMLSEISALLRHSLESDHLAEVPLDQELEFAGRYLEIERCRFPDRIRYEAKIDPIVRSALVPNLLLQPLVENAVKHGVSHLCHPGRILLNARAVHATLVIELRNDAPTANCPTPGSGAVTPSLGVGLRTTRERLTQRYGAAAELTVDREPAGSFRVRLSLPLRFSA